MASIAREEEEINKILQESKDRLAVVDEKLAQLVQEHSSIAEDIEILSERLGYIDESIDRKEKVYESISGFVKDGEESYAQLVESTETLLHAFTKEEKRITELIRRANADS